MSSSTDQEKQLDSATNKSVKNSSSSNNAAMASDEWNHAPILMFRKWAASPDANDGRGFNPGSIKTYSSMWGKFVKFCPESPALAGEATIEAFLRTLDGRVKNSQSEIKTIANPAGIRRRYLSMLDKLHTSLVRIGVRSSNNAQSLLFKMDLEQRALTKPLPVALDADEEKSLREVVDGWPDGEWRDKRDKAILSLLIGSGIKVSEIKSLRIDDVNFEKEPLHVHITGGRKERVAPLAESSIAGIRQWVEALKIQNLADKRLFLGEGGQVLSSSTIYRIVSLAIEKAGLNPMHSGPSVLRHTFAIRQVRAGRTVSTISSWLGHENERSTEVYKFMVVDPGGEKPV